MAAQENARCGGNVMAKRAEKTDRLAALEQRRDDIATEAAQVESELKALDPLKDATPAKARELTERLAALRAMAEMLPKEIEHARQEQDATRTERLEASLVRLRGEEEAGLVALIASFNALRDALAEVKRIAREIHQSGDTPHLALSPQLLDGLRIQEMAWRQLRPELLGLPAKPTRQELQQAEAYEDAAHLVNLWENLDSIARESKNEEARAQARRRADELGPRVAWALDHCKRLGIAPPKGGPSWLASIARYWAELTRPTLADQLAALPDDEREQRERLIGDLIGRP
jgi:hypothetical protein